MHLYSNKAKDLFTTNEEDEYDNEYASMTQNHFLCISALEYKTKEILNHVATDEIGKFTPSLCSNLMS